MNLPTDPYVLGCWLASGSVSSSQISIDRDDVRHFLLEFARVGYPPLVRDPHRGGTTRALTPELRSLGLLGHVPKHIPTQYLDAGREQRLAVLQGMLDIAGQVDPASGVVELSLADSTLAEQARELTRSLGHTPGEIARQSAAAWRFEWAPDSQVFRLGRKAARLASAWT